MVKKKRNRLGQMLERFSRKVTEATGTSTAFHNRAAGDRCLDSYRTVVPLFRYLAVGNQHRHNDRDVPDGFPDSAQSKQGCPWQSI